MRSQPQLALRARRPLSPAPPVPGAHSAPRPVLLTVPRAHAPRVRASSERRLHVADRSLRPESTFRAFRQWRLDNLADRLSVIGVSAAPIRPIRGARLERTNRALVEPTHLGRKVPWPEWGCFARRGWPSHGAARQCPEAQPPATRCAPITIGFPFADPLPGRREEDRGKGSGFRVGGRGCAARGAVTWRFDVFRTRGFLGGSAGTHRRVGSPAVGPSARS